MLKIGTEPTPMRLRYHTYEFDQCDLHVRTLRNRQEFEDPDDIAQALGISSSNWSLFGVVWDSGEVLARLMWNRVFHGEKILEVGCGIGLASLVLSVRAQNISATDRHPDAQKFLDYNSALNELSPIKFERCNWEHLDSSLGKFDLIIGSDLLYDRENLEHLSRFIDQHAEPACEVLLVDPNRGLCSKFSSKMETLGFTACPRITVDIDSLKQFKGSILGYNRAKGL